MKGFKYLALLTALVTGCDGKFEAQKTANITIMPQANVCSEVGGSPALIFPRVTPPRTEVRVVTIGQGGEADLRVDEVYIEGFETCDRVALGYTESDRLPEDVVARCPLMIDVRPTLPITLGADENFTVNIRFQPSTLQVPPGTRLFIKSNVREKEEMCVGIDFQSARPEIIAEPVVAFPGGVAGTEFLQVRNIGSGPLVVQQRTLNLISAPAVDPQTQEPVPEFIVTEQTPLPWEIPANGAETLEIRYEPFDGDRDTAELVFVSNDPATPELRVTLTSAPVYGVLGVSPNPVVFGVPAGGEAIEKTVSFTNSGVRYVDVQEVILTQPGTDYTLSGQPSFRLAGGASRELRVIYRPLTAEGSDGELRIPFDDGDDRTPGELVVPLVRDGSALPPILNIDPAVVDLSELALGASETVDITITNSGGEALDITRIGLSTDDDAGLGVPPSDPEFEIVSGGNAVNLASGESHTVQVKLSRGADQRIVLIAALVIESNAASSPDVVFLTSNPPRE